MLIAHCVKSIITASCAFCHSPVDQKGCGIESFDLNFEKISRLKG